MTSFLKKLTGGEDNNTHEEDTLLDSNLDYQFDIEDEDAIFDLPIDVYQDNDNMYLRAFIPGVKPESIDLQLTRDIVEISGERSESEKIDSGNYTQRELVWGKFQKKVLLSHEIDVDRVKANTSYGMITLKMPKLDKDRAVKVSLN